MPSTKRNGFTLIELSIVLVVIGLIVGAVMAGQVLIKAAKIRSAVTKLQHYSAAYNTFKLKYGCIMGDCPNATDYFGATYVSAGSYPACTTATNGIGNGDGDGLIDSGGGGSSYCESVFAMRALRLSNLLATNLLSQCSSGATYFFNGINDGCAVFSDSDVYDEISPYEAINAINWVFTGPSSGSSGKFPIMSPVEAKGIDDKIDDGIPNKGKFYGLNTASLAAGTGVVIANSCRTSGVYNTNETLTCRTVYYLE